MQQGEAQQEFQGGDVDEEYDREGAEGGSSLLIWEEKWEFWRHIAG